MHQLADLSVSPYIYILFEYGDHHICMKLLIWAYTEYQHIKTHHHLFSLSDHHILSREWRVIVHQVQTNYHGRHIASIISQVWPNCRLWGISIMVRCVLSQLKPSELYILSCVKGRGLQTSAFATAKNLELLGLYPIHKNTAFAVPLALMLNPDSYVKLCSVNTVSVNGLHLLFQSWGHSGHWF